MQEFETITAIERIVIIIFFIYDDRGCEVIALDFKRIRHLYEKYHDWVEEYKYM